MDDKQASAIELEQILGRLLHQEVLGFRELELLERGVFVLSGTIPFNSEIATWANNIWLAIHQLPFQNYWNNISNIIARAKISYTKSLALNSITKRIANDWPYLDQQQKVNITDYLISLQSEAIEKGSQFGLMGEVMTTLFRLEWKGLLAGFIAKMTENLTTISENKILYSLQVFKRILRESYDNWTEDLLTSEQMEFRAYMEEEMKIIMNLVCFCLKESGKNQLIRPCLNFLQQILEKIPVFQIFSSLIFLEVLQELFSTKEYREQAVGCLKEIFAFKENGITQEHHSKIAKRLFSILEKGMAQSYPSLKPVTNFDKQSSSTADSICSKVTVSLNKPKTRALSPDLVELLYLYLTRYITSMDSRPDDRYFEIQSDRSTKLLFSKELYDYFEKGYWRFVKFLIEFGKGSDRNLVVLNEQEQQIQFRFLVCAKLILTLFGKLGLPYQEVLQDLLEMYILRLAPLQKGFRKFYILFDLIMNQSKVCIESEEVQDFSEDYCQAYTQGMETIMKNRTLAQVYSSVLQRVLDRVIQQQEYLNSPTKGKYHVALKVSWINRISWSLIHGFRAGGQGLQLISINKIVAGFIHQTFLTNDVILKKCYSLNSKYILQAFKGTQFSNIILSSFLSHSVDLVYQFNINLISNIFMHPLFVYKDLGNDWVNGVEGLLKRVKEVKEIGTYNEEFNRIYPAIFRLSIKIIQNPANKEHQQDLILKIKQWLNFLTYSQTISILKGINQANMLDVLTLKKLNQLLINFQDISLLLLKEGETRQRGTYWMLKHHLIEIKEILKQLDFRYKLYSDYVEGQTFQNFQISEIIEFRERYNLFICNFIKLFSLRTRIQIKDETIPIEKRMKLLKQRTQLIQIAEKRLYQDFEAQIQFKCSNYLSTALQYYRFLQIQKNPKHVDIINQSIKGITTILSQQRVKNTEKFITAKLNFWKGLVQNFMEELKGGNIQEFCEIYNKLSQFSVKNAQLCLQMVERLLEKFESQYKQADPPALWSNFMVIFKASFEKLFDQVCKNEQMFKRVANILYFCIFVADGTQRKLIGQFQGKKSNVEVLYLFIRQHVKTTVGECSMQQDLVLQSLFSQKNKARFANIMKDYKVGLMRWLKVKSTST